MREARRKQRRHKRTIASSKHAAETRHEDFNYTRKQNLRWLQDQYGLPDHGAISQESADELTRYFNVRDEEKLGNERLGEEARAFLGRLEERQMMRKARGVCGRVKDWWMEPMLLGIVEGDEEGEGEGQGLVMGGRGG